MIETNEVFDVDEPSIEGDIEKNYDRVIEYQNDPNQENDQLT